MTPVREALEPCREDRRKYNTLRHGHTKTRAYSPTYSSWQAMLARIRYPERDAERKYVKRGINVCERWLSFDNFLADMGERPSGTTLDRIDNDGDYGPTNCKWSTPIEQARNRRNARLTFDTAVEVVLRRFRGEPSRLIAADFGISESLPREIEKGRCWKDARAAALAIIETSK